jgi:hypothetical protein
VRDIALVIGAAEARNFRKQRIGLGAAHIRGFIVDTLEGESIARGGHGEALECVFWARAKIVDDGIDCGTTRKRGQGGSRGYTG